MASLTVDHDGQRRDIELDGEPLTVGRDPDNRLVLGHGGVSRFHCRIVPGKDGFELEDLGSSGGTRVDGQVVTRSVLRSGQTIAVGPARLRFHEAGESTMSATVPEFVATSDDLPWGLYFIDGPRVGTLIAFGERVRVGRSPDCELVLDDTEISTFHCEFEPVGPGAVVRDLGSTNGTKLGGRAFTGERALREGDLLGVGPHLIRFDRHPLPPPSSTSGLMRSAAEAGLFVAIALMLWTLGVRVIARPLLERGPESTAPAGTSFLKLKENYRFRSAGEWKLKPLADRDLLSVSGRGEGAGQLRIVRALASAVGEGRRVTGSVEAAGSGLRVTLVGTYLDERDELIAVIYSPALPAGGGSKVIAYEFPPIAGARWLQPGYLVEGAQSQALLLGPLLDEATRQPALKPVRAARPWGALSLTPTGLLDVELGDAGLARLELGRIDRTGLMVGTTRHQEQSAIGEQGGRLLLDGMQIGATGRRLRYSLGVDPVGAGARATMTGGEVTHVRLTWLRSLERAALFYRGISREDGEVRPLLDEVVIADEAGRELTFRFDPAVTLEQRWVDAAGRPWWQLRFVEQKPRLTVELRPGDRQREREMLRVRSRFERAEQKDDLPAALRLLARWRALAADPRQSGLQEASRRLHGRVEQLVQEAIGRGRDGLPRLYELLASYRGSAYEDALEAAVARALLTPQDPAERAQQARWLLGEGRHLAAYGHYALARTALSLLIQLHPDTDEAGAALKLLAMLPAR